MSSKNPFIFAAGLCLVCSFMLTFAASSLKPMQMKNQKIDIWINIGTGTKNFTAYTMDLSKKYIEINSDYRS